VNLLAIVRDKKGSRSTRSTKKTFALEQDGRAQTITQFARESDVPLTFGILADTGPGNARNWQMSARPALISSSNCCAKTRQGVCAALR